MIFVPQITTLAGLTLTPNAWACTKTQYVSLSLKALLMRPGFDVLTHSATLKAYFGLNQTVVLNATDLYPHQRGDGYVFRSIYDGAKITHSAHQLVELFNLLQPEYLLLPRDFPERPALLQRLPSCKIFIDANEQINDQDRIYGVYSDQSNAYSGDLPFYMLASTLPIKITGSSSEIWIESDWPASQAMSSIVFSGKTEITLAVEEYAEQFMPIANTCECQTCAQGFTRAYLHHLWHNTPLLCQRLLVEHNVYQVQNAISHYIAKG